MKRIGAAVLMIGTLCLVFCISVAESIFPSLNETLGISIPSIEKCTGSEKERRSETSDSRHIESFQQISYEDYDKIGRCFGKSGFRLSAEKYSENLIELTLTKDNKEVVVTYDPVKYSLKATYPKYYNEDRQSLSVTREDPSVFPDLEEVAGPILPRLSAALFREPDSSVQKSPGTLAETYNHFSQEDYQLVSAYLQERGCTVVEYYREGNVLSITLEKKGKAFLMKYDPKKQTAAVEYSDAVCIEPVVTSTPVPTATPKPTVSPEEYYSYAALFVGIVKETQKNPESMQVHSIRVMEYQNDSYIVIDCSGMNGFGGYNRSTFSFKFEKGYISLSGNSSDYDTYEKHQNQFHLIEILDVDEVLKMLK